MEYTVDIWFVNLGLKFQDWVKSFKIGNFEVFYYGCIIAASVLLALTVACIVARKTGQDDENYAELMIWGVLFGIIGARLYYVAFDWDAYKDNLKEIFNLRAGGLAIYGGVIAGALTAWVVCRVKKLNFRQVLDTAFVGVVLAQSTGRWSNFVNMECFGGYTDNLVAMRLNVAKVNSAMITQELLDKAVSVDGVTYIQVHPTFLYESLWNLALFIVLLLVTRKKRFHGQVFLLYLMGYGVGRFWIEGLRTDQLKIGHTGIAISQVVSVVLCAAALVLYILGMKKAREAEAIVARAEAEAAEEIKGNVLEMIEEDRKASEALAEAEAHAQETMEEAADAAEQARSDMEATAGEILEAEADSAHEEAQAAAEQAAQEAAEKAAQADAAAEALKDAAEEHAEALKDAAEEHAEALKDAAEEHAEALQDAAEEAVAKVQETADDAVARLQEAADAAIAKLQEAAAAAGEKKDGR